MRTLSQGLEVCFSLSCCSALHLLVEHDRPACVQAASCRSLRATRLGHVILRVAITSTLGLRVDDVCLPSLPARITSVYQCSKECNNRNSKAPHTYVGSKLCGSGTAKSLRKFTSRTLVHTCEGLQTNPGSWGLCKRHDHDHDNDTQLELQA